MIINTYNPQDMSLTSSGVTGVDFGDILKGQHNSQPIVIKPEIELGESFTQLAFYLEAVNGLSHSQFGKYKSSEATIGVLSGSAYLSDHFTVQEGISDFYNFENTSDTGLVLDSGNPEYIWLDAQAGSGEISGSNQVNFRFVFEYV